MFKKAGDGWKKFWWGKGLQPHRDNVIEDIYLRFYTGSTTAEYSDYKLPRSQELLTDGKFQKSNPTILYVHGFEETAEQESVKVMAEAYLKGQPDTNFVLVDWANMAFGNYVLNAAPNTKKVAAAVAAEIVKLSNLGLDTDLLHLIGHSLGGQIIGFIGRDLQQSNIKLKRLSALDPAFPLYYPGLFLSHINANDAEFVDIVHTDAGFYGAPVATGSLDFWPNGGVGKQPGCPKFAPVPLSDDSLCSHWRSWRFWAESVTNPTAFPSITASSYSAFSRENRTPNTAGNFVYMGVKADKNAKGNYYLTTNCCTPFGKGMAGTYVAK
ncbi:pancreatic triacylglycerol lipase-like isoform X2 [Arctopsyche grandis]|uniref:pancreatic triacylglycerol lipase-like isoform X2 n=1 Tax=Arctopsyche grandis TaxID=121162 RepID=UPI00406D98CC